ncbi:uncharacterized protein MYCFIDRAFT_207262 [Pseudocercospora fijiensis CIRAD86]|uniref:Protein kinase domain-containing protein n=1 Tax=Pseudocercospora fijiensis (strain CIRAD86) TaxID=383855 RepID=M3AIG7_PSEFD|nr:uncharacterized protein MYCFIDRAFT_207262 [Pseudocercospora fijiensis CIRAD86]EME84391.1 hypothetical protein MYCFIDRAFT_207262 [Pseudocercospora fijiensis CIRAD86]
MEGYHYSPGIHRPGHLSKLYSDAKKSALTSLQVQTASNAQYTSLHRKYRIQKDRLIAWGLEWSDGEKGSDANIDDAVTKAGLSETVESVLRNIQEVTEEAERIKSASLPLIKEGEAFPQRPAVFDEARYEDLLRDLTTSIDTLYDLTQSRRALARGEHPTFEDPIDIPMEQPLKPSSSISKKPWKRLYDNASFASSGTTLLNPTFSRPFLSPYAGLPSRIELSALRLPIETPPPYEAVGVPSTTRMVALLVRNRVSGSVQAAIASSAPEVPVLVEYANYDATYRATGVPPPLQRLEALATFFQPMRADSQTNLSLLGYFEDSDQPRIGLVYDLPYTIQNKLQTGMSTEPLAPLSLLKLVQKANKQQSSSTEVPAPALEHRFRMALRLTEQLHSLHASQLAHGNINSSSVIFTTTETETEANRLEQLRKPLWASFDLFSKSNIEGVNRASDFNIYRHPLDEPNGVDREFPVDLKFDLYGLGLILLEIGLWTPIGDLYKAKYTLADFKLRLEKIWIPKLAAKCGSAYMRAVETCLRLSDDMDNSRLTAEGVYGLLLQFLKRCCLLDDVGSPTELIPASELVSQPSSPAESYRSPRRRHAIRRPSEASSLARQLSETVEPRRSMSGKSAARSHRHSSYPALTPLAGTTLTDPEQSRQGSRAGHISTRPGLAEVKEQIMEGWHSRSEPSIRDFKRRVTLIQQRWRQCHAVRQQRLQAAEATRTSMDEEAEQLANGKRAEFPDVPLPQNILDHWQNTMCFQMNALVAKALRHSKESCSIRLCPYGESKATARPTLIVGCKSTSKVKHALKRHLKYDPSMYDIRVKKEGEIRRCRKSRRERALEAAERSMAPYRDPNVEKAVNPDYQERPLCGASIGAFRYEEHLPPASFGGIVLIDGKPYGMSVHHMLEPEDVSDDEDANDEDEEDDDDDSSSLGSSDGESGICPCRSVVTPSSVVRRSIANIIAEDDDLSTVRPPSAHSSDDEPLPSYDTAGDCPGLFPGDMEEIAITQPALDDAIDLDLHVEEEDEDEEDSGIDEDHLLSYRLGQVHASSGLRRTLKSHEGGFKSISQSLPQEIDWALFELLPPRLPTYNIIKGGTRFCRKGGDRHGNSYPTSIRASQDIAHAKVHCLGRTSGLGSGIVSSTMELVKIHGRSTFSASWTITAANFGVGGDSGAWVISNEDGRVCGHVLASRQGRTYICPMDLLLEDIKQTLGAEEISLPVLSGEKGNKSRPVSGERPGSSRETSPQCGMVKAMKDMRLEGGGLGLLSLFEISPALARNSDDEEQTSLV